MEKISRELCTEEARRWKMVRYDEDESIPEMENQTEKGVVATPKKESAVKNFPVVVSIEEMFNVINNKLDFLISSLQPKK